MRRLPRVTVALLALSLTLSAGAVAAGTQTERGGPLYGVKQVVKNLTSVSSFTFAPDGDIFFNERLTGKIKRWDSATKTKSTFATVANLSGDNTNELGLLGVALHPDYPATPYVYVFATVVRNGAIRMQVLRFTDTAGVGTNRLIAHEFDTTAGGGHVGGRILFGPDDRLYIVTGERFDAALAQDLTVERGKVMRFDVDTNLDGTLAPDGAPVFQGGSVEDDAFVSFGHRNSFGLGFDPENGNLWESENGPECNDELNLILETDNPNYAWGPDGDCSTPPKRPRNTNNSGPTPRVLPESYWRATIAPTGLAFCDGCALDAAAEGNLLLGAFNTGQILLFDLDAERDDVLSRTIAYQHTRQVLSIERGIDGRLYFSDGRAIFRLKPAA
ncbi:MAG: PQQ-dependent sugar dehydrogenase [Actinomycetota bacterium]